MAVHGVELKGMEELLKHLEQLGKNVEEVHEEALMAGAEVIKEAGIQKAPVRSGKLKANIIISDMNENGTVDIGPDQQGDAFYGYFLEFGRKGGTYKVRKGKKMFIKSYPKMDSHPFMQPAFEENVDAVQEKMAEVIKSRLGL
jgi:HK97 gp10 family phage protein